MLGYPEQAVKDELLKRTEEANRLGREDSLPFVTECLVPVYSGIALIRKGQTSEGVALLERGLAAWERGGGRASSRYYKSVLAEGMAQPGDVAGALHLVDEAIVPIERPGWEERHYYAEALRIKGWLLSLKGDAAGAERAYTASLDRALARQGREEATVSGIGKRDVTIANRSREMPAPGCGSAVSRSDCPAPGG